jgi:thiamine pyrophosphate-dependent acetolactate synthase large subunit-like protein
MGIRVETAGALPAALREAFASEQPVVVDVVIDRAAYATLLPALRG